MESLLLDRLSTLSHPHRMAIFRLLMRRYPDALPVAEILDVLDLKPSTASVYLSALKAADLVTQTRQGTSLLYGANISASHDIVEGLFNDCCAGRAEICLPNPQKTPNVLFLCTGNSARSIMAETILRDWEGGKFSVASAGTTPRSSIHPLTLEVLHSKGHDTNGLYAKNIDVIMENDSAEYDFVFTVCDSAANQDHAAYPGAPIASHWGTPDPVPDNTGFPSRKHFEHAYTDINRRVSQFAALPFETASRSDLQKWVDDIARN